MVQLAAPSRAPPLLLALAPALLAPSCGVHTVANNRSVESVDWSTPVVHTRTGVLQLGGVSVAVVTQLKHDDEQGQRWPAPTKGLPVYWFGHNMTGFDTADYLARMTSRFDLAIYGSTHAALTPPQYQQESEKLSTQCARLKTISNATTRCAAYRQGWLAMSNYDEELAVMNAADTFDWFLKDDTGQQWAHCCVRGAPKSACMVQSLYWNFANASAAAYYQQNVIKPISLDPSVDAVFFVSTIKQPISASHLLLEIVSSFSG